MENERLTGGCQCGAVRFAVEGPLGRASLCHCRMCQKAFGAFYGALVSAPGVRWTRGAPTRYRSSNRAQRGFCARCGTTLTFEPDGGAVDLAIAAFDDPAPLRPSIQMARDQALPWIGELEALPQPMSVEADLFEAHYAGVISYQQPDHDTDG